MKENRKRNRMSINVLALLTGLSVGMVQAEGQWVIDSAEEWESSLEARKNLVQNEGKVRPEGNEASFSTKLHSFAQPSKVGYVEVKQSDDWLNWTPVENVGPKNAGDAPIFLALKNDDYWMFGRYGGGSKASKAVIEILKIQEAVEQGLKSKAEGDKSIAKIKAKAKIKDLPKGGQFAANDPLQTNGEGGDAPGLGGYHAWHSKDMKHWVHHGPISNFKSRWMTTAEYKDGKFYFYYDNPNDQDPHLIVDSNLKDGKVGKDHGLVFLDPSHGSDNAVIRGEDGKFHMIYEDWSFNDASAQAWDAPVAGHAISPDGIADWKALDYALDHRTKPTGKTGTFVRSHKSRKERMTYQEHYPKQNAYGDWAALRVGTQYYLFADFDPADNKVSNGKSERDGMSVAWFTSESLGKPFSFCGNIGKGHPDPDIGFAEGQFYLITQFRQDFVSPGPWVDGVQARAGVDTSGDGKVDQWTDWQELSEKYDHKPGFAKHIEKIPARIDTSSLPVGKGVKLEFRLKDETSNASQPVLDKVTVMFK